MKAVVRARMEAGWTCPAGVHKDCFVIPPKPSAAVSVSRETLEQIEAAMERLIRECRIDLNHPYDHSGPRAGTLIVADAALSSVREVLKGEGMTCPRCRGLGTVQAPVGGYGNPAVRETCPMCGGTGRLRLDTDDMAGEEA